MLLILDEFYQQSNPGFRVTVTLATEEVVWIRKI